MKATEKRANDRIRPRDRDAVLQALGAGVVPRRGQHLIQVGRERELAAMMDDLERLKDGGSAVRFLIGPYGSGKTFFAQLIRAVALKQGFVSVHADLTPDRRLYSTSGHGRALFAELTRNMATRSQPDGGALESIVERFVSHAQQEADSVGDTVDAVIRARLAGFTELVGGYDLASVIRCYWRGHVEDDSGLRQAALRWLRGEYATRTDAKRDLDVRRIIDDSNIYDSLKLLARFVRSAGYVGLIVVLDEMVNLFKLTHTQARRSNYERVLSIVNDGLQGSSESMGVIMVGTPEFLTDTGRGLYSYDALKTRLAENRFARNGLQDLSGPVIRLSNLEPEELYVLLQRIRHVQASGREDAYLVPDAALKAFMEHCHQQIGASFFQTPRHTIKAFVHLLAVLEQNPEADWRELLGGVDIEPDRDSAPAIAFPETRPGASGDLHSFRL